MYILIHVVEIISYILSRDSMILSPSSSELNTVFSFLFSYDFPPFYMRCSMHATSCRFLLFRFS